MRDAATWIDRLGLAPHPEGGYFREVYRSGFRLDGSDRSRSVATSIYYLLESGEVSHLHRIRSDEVWNFHTGCGLAIHVFGSGERYVVLPLGTDIEAGELPQRVVPAGCWFGATTAGPGEFSLVGCTVAPGFEFRDFELADRASLVQKFPTQRAIIESLTR